MAPSPPITTGLSSLGDRSLITLNSLLHAALYNKKEEVQSGQSVKLADVRRRLIEKLQVFHRITRSGEEVRSHACLACLPA